MKTRAGQAEAYSSGFEFVNFLSFVNPLRARQIFAPVCSNSLNVASAMLCAVFTNIHQKFDSRRMDAFYEDTT